MAIASLEHRKSNLCHRVGKQGSLLWQFWKNKEVLCIFAKKIRRMLVEELSEIIADQREEITTEDMSSFSERLEASQLSPNSSLAQEHRRSIGRA